MFELLKEQPADNIIALMGQFANDKRADKLDLGVGVYKNQNGVTPVMNSVKKAEAFLLESQTSKSYVGLLGNLDFVHSMKNLILSESFGDESFVGAQAPGGTGSLHQMFLLLRQANPNLTVWISNPTWPNHSSMLRHLGINFSYYRYFSEDTGDIDFSGMIEDLSKSKPSDVVLLHGCCHNPTGVNINTSEWDSISELCLKNEITPMVDLAYQGFGDGLEEDVVGLRRMVKVVPELIIAASCSKNFGLYRDRVGVALYINENKKVLSLVADNLKSVNRLTYSFPPDWGGTVVNTILNDSELRKIWHDEIQNIRSSISFLRLGLCKALKRSTNSDRFSFLGQHKGMFSRLGLTGDQVARLRKDHAIYMVGDSRINIAGLNEKSVNALAMAVSKVL